MANFTDPGADLINGGLWRSSPYFEFLTVPKAGHFVPQNYFAPTYQFLWDYIDGKRLSCHKSSASSTDGCSVVKQQCEAMNQCNGQGTCNQVTGQCECNAGYKFADCSKKVVDLTDGYDENLNMYGPMWYTMQFSGNSTSTLTLTPNITSDIYILKSAKGDPNNFVYDMSFMNVTSSTTIDADGLGLTSNEGYSVAVYVSAVNEPTNELYYGQLSVSFEVASELATALFAQYASIVAIAVVALI